MSDDFSAPVLKASRAEYRARRWDILVTGVLAMLLLIPMPFVQFRSWPDNRLILERPVLPWSSFRLCYRPLDGGPPVEEQYRFDHAGRLRPPVAADAFPMALESVDLPWLQWQKQPEIGLQEIHDRGAFLDVRVRWQPVLAYPLKMLLEAWKDHPLGSQGAGAKR